MPTDPTPPPDRVSTCGLKSVAGYLAQIGLRTGAALYKGGYKDDLLGFSRWLLVLPIVLVVLFACGQIASLRQPVVAAADTRSKLSADYSPWGFASFAPVDIEIISQIRGDGGIGIANLVVPGIYWPEPAPAQTEPTGLPSRATSVAELPTATSVATGNASAGTPTPTATSRAASPAYPTASPQATATYTRTPTVSPTAQPTLFPTSTATATRRSPDLPTATSTSPPSPAASPTPKPTETASPGPSSTPQPSVTQPPPTTTATTAPSPTVTTQPTRTPTNTAVPPTPTETTPPPPPAPTDTPVPADTPTPTPITPVPVETPTPLPPPPNYQAGYGGWDSCWEQYLNYLPRELILTDFLEVNPLARS